MIDKIKQILRDEKKREVITYLIFGLLTTLVNWLVYFTMTALLGPEGHPKGSAAQMLIYNGSQWTAWVISVIFAYLTNRRYVFGSEEKRAGAWAELFRFASARLAGYLLFDLLLYNLLVFNLGISHEITKLLMNVLVVIFNYFASKFLIFKKAKRSDT